MNMRGHQREPVYAHLTPLCRLAETNEKYLIIGVNAEHRATVISTLDHVVSETG
jgi:hypothetical protein